MGMKTTIEDDKVKDKISEDEKKKIADKCDEAIKWLDANQLAEVEEFNDKQKEVEAVCNPIITKLYQSAGGAGGMPGGMPGVCQEECQVQVPDQEVQVLDQPLKKLTKPIIASDNLTCSVINNCILMQRLA